MLESETLQFENARAVQALYVGDLKLLKTLEQRLSVRVTTREGWIKLEGESENVQRAKRVFEQLEHARRNGVPIRRHEFNYALEAVTEVDDSGDPSSRRDLRDLLDTKLYTSPRRAPIMPKTATQRAYVKAIAENDLTFGIGPAGTGKTYLAVVMAVGALKEGKVKRIVLTRPAVEAGENLGFLPGDLQEKVDPYLRPLYDALHDVLGVEQVAKSMERGLIEIAPLAYMRGRTLDDSFVILDEAQNTTPEQMKMFLTRLGFGSKMVITGDITQIDLPRGKTSGLVQAEQVLRGIEDIGFVYFAEQDVVRHSLVQQIILAYQREQENKDQRG